MSHKIVRSQLASAVVNDGTFTVSYPARTAPESGTSNAGDYYQAMQHKLVMNGAVLLYPDDFDLTFGTSSITVTNKSGATWPAEARFVLQLEEPGRRPFTDVAGTQQAMAGMTKSPVMLINLGAPDVADADGYFASQDLTSAGVASVSTTVAAAIAAAALAGRADVPRNVVAAWTGTAVLTVTGKDVYGNTVVESSGSGTSFTGKKAFSQVTGISVSANVTSLTVGTGVVLGLPVFVPGKQHIVAEIADGALVGDREAIQIPFQINQTDFLAPTAARIIAPVSGRITKFSTVVQVALGTTVAETAGTVHLVTTLGAVTGSTLTTYGTAVATGAPGSVASAEIPVGSANAVVVEGQSIAVTPSSTFASAGAVNGIVEIMPGGGGYGSGTFVAGITTAGGSTATTGDVRGTYSPPFTPDGAIVAQLLVSLPDPGYRGVTQYAG